LLSRRAIQLSDQFYCLWLNNVDLRGPQYAKDTGITFMDTSRDSSHSAPWISWDLPSMLHGANSWTILLHVTNVHMIFEYSSLSVLQHALFDAAREFCFTHPIWVHHSGQLAHQLTWDSMTEEFRVALLLGTPPPSGMFKTYDDTGVWGTTVALQHWTHAFVLATATILQHLFEFDRDLRAGEEI
jgi:hypothetical protein